MPGFGGAVKLTGESEYRRALQGITQQLREQSAQMRAVVGSYESGESAQEAARRKTKELNDVLDKQQSALRELQGQQRKMERAVQDQADAHQTLKDKYDEEKRKLDEIGRTLGEASDEYKKQEKIVGELENELKKSEAAQSRNEQSMSRMRTEIAKAETACNNTKKEIRALGESAEDSGKKAEKGSDGFGVMQAALGNLVSDAIERTIAGLKKLADKVIEVGKLAYANYADYEQLVGGVETLFGESADIVQKNAAKAYRTAGISANKYMEQATSFSATLLQGLEGDTARAAAAADLAIRDMSDNANKMGTDMSMIQSAYQGFAKDNYTMLDNLKLGYGGTAGEMARLINDTGVMKDVVNEAGEAFVAEAKTVKDVPFDKMIEAIHIVQEQMGITGTTSLEAAGTISGSAGSMKAAWENLTVAIGDGNGDIKKSVGEFIDTVIAAAKNAIPRIKQIADGMKDMVISFVRDSIPKLKRSIPEIKPVIEAFEWFVKHRKAFVTAVGAMLAAFAIAKLATFTKAISANILAMISQIATFKAHVVATASSTGHTIAFTAAQTALNTAMAANPVGLVVAALGILVGVIGTVIASTNKLTDAEKAEQEAAQKIVDGAASAKQSYDDLAASREANLETNLTELGHYQSLWNELQNITEANGQVKLGYEERAAVICGILSDALGIELDLNNGVIEGYQKLRGEIDKTIEKKKAQLILDTQYEAYKEAYAHRAEAIEEFKNADSALTEAQRKESEARNALREIENEDILKYTIGEKAAWAIRKEIAEGELSTAKEETAAMQTAYNERKSVLEGYIYDIELYNHNLEQFEQGHYDEMSTLTSEYAIKVKNTGDAYLAERRAQYEQDKDIYDATLMTARDTGSEIVAAAVDNYAAQSAASQAAYKQLVDDTNAGLSDTAIAWQDGLSVINGWQKKGLDETLANGEAMPDHFGVGVKKGESKATSQVKTLTDKAIGELQKGDGPAKKRGQTMTDRFGGGVQSGSDGVRRTAEGVAIDAADNGFGSQRVYRTVWNNGDYIDGGLADGIDDNAWKPIQAATRVVNAVTNKMRNVAQIQSPSKVTMKIGQYITEGLRLGMLKDAAGVARDAAGLGETIRQSLSGATDGMRLNAGTIAPAVTARAETRRDSMVEEFKSALSQMRVMLDGEAAGRFVERTVTRAVFS